MKRRTGRVFGLVGLAFASLTAQSCLSFQTYCEERVDCAEGNDADVDACVVDQDAAEDQASLYGCTEWFEAFVECREADAKCENNNYVLTNGDCEDEREDLDSCLGDRLPPSPF